MIEPNNALGRLADFFDRRTTRQGWVARRALGREFGSDQLLRDQLIGRFRGLLASGGGDSVLVLGLVEELVDLEGPALSFEPGVDHLLSLSAAPGAFGEGCTAARHAHRVCEHSLGGFFALAPETQRVAPASLPNGRVYRTESQARFALSCWVLQVVIRAGQIGHSGVQRHLDSFANLIGAWEAWDEFLVPDLAFGAMAALAAAPERWQPTLESLVRLAGHQQLRDGTWPRVDFFAALDGLSRVDHPAARAVLERATPVLLQRQRDDGSFGSLAEDERALIGLRVLQRIGAQLPGG